MEHKLDKDLKSTLSRLSVQLQDFLIHTEQCLVIAQDRYNQVESVIKPEIREIKTTEECLCDSLANTHLSNENEDTELMKTISKTLNTAKSIRTSSKSKLTTVKSEKNISLKPSNSSCTVRENSQTNTSTSKKTLSKIENKNSNSSVHCPSCPLYKSIESSSNVKVNSVSLRTSIASQKIPSLLTRTLRECSQVLINFDNKTSKNEIRNKFCTELQKRDEKFCDQYLDHDLISTVLKYISILNKNYRKTKSDSYTPSWIFYSDVKELELFNKSCCVLQTKLSWNKILEFMVKDFIPILRTCDMSVTQKVYIFKTIKTILNSVNCHNPSVPIFRLKVK